MNSIRAFSLSLFSSLSLLSYKAFADIAYDGGLDKPNMLLWVEENHEGKKVFKSGNCLPLDPPIRENCSTVLIRSEKFLEGRYKSWRKYLSKDIPGITKKIEEEIKKLKTESPELVELRAKIDDQRVLLKSYNEDVNNENRKIDQINSKIAPFIKSNEKLNKEIMAQDERTRETHQQLELIESRLLEDPDNKIYLRTKEQLLLDLDFIVKKVDEFLVKFEKNNIIIAKLEEKKSKLQDALVPLKTKVKQTKQDISELEKEYKRLFDDLSVTSPRLENFYKRLEDRQQRMADLESIIEMLETPDISFRYSNFSSQEKFLFQDHFFSFNFIPHRAFYLRFYDQLGCKGRVKDRGAIRLTVLDDRSSILRKCESENEYKEKARPGVYSILIGEKCHDTRTTSKFREFNTICRNSILGQLKEFSIYCGEFNEQKYLSTYPDIAEAVKTGFVKSGREHWDKYGKNEHWRKDAVGCPKYKDEIAE